ncbi:hypothetical protein NL676_007312 [Syzygium grande]|nr:hypothetical protein NL676_007312 [Syzygium grande]
MASGALEAAEPEGATAPPPVDGKEEELPEKLEAEEAKQEDRETTAQEEEEAEASNEEASAEDDDGDDAPKEKESEENPKGGSSVEKQGVPERRRKSSATKKDPVMPGIERPRVFRSCPRQDALQQGLLHQKGKVVIDAFRLINPQTMMLGQEPRQTTSNLGHLDKPSIQALIHGLNRHYYSIAINYMKNELEEKMLLNLHKKKWTNGLTLNLQLRKSILKRKNVPFSGKSNSTKTVIIAVAASVSVVLFIGVAILLVVKRKKQQPRQRVEGEVEDEISTAESLQFDFRTIRAATDNFSNSKKLGQGGFGAVYMGWLSNGQKIAVKRLSRNSGQGEVEFKNEVMLLARLQHRNLVRLQRFCLEGIEQLLIYEFVPNSSLDQFIFDPLKRESLDWDRRHKIIMGVARGLLYLHKDSRLRIIHRDLKASNVLLDLDMNPKISDFGMVRLFELDQTQAETNRIVGTYGYMAPEYVMHGNFSVKSDVFSFGVLVLEIVSGQKNNLFRVGDNSEVLTSYVWKSWREGTISNIIDPSITSGSSTEIARCIHIGLLCVQEIAANRPTMALVLLMLNGHSVTLQVPSRPAFFIHSGAESDISSTQDYNSRVSEANRSRSRSNNHSKNEVSVTEPYPR